MSDEVAIRVENVSKTFKIPHEKISSIRGAFVNMFRKNSYEKFQALDNVSFEVKKGEFFGIIGRNGSGKSTLLKILAGIYQADRGKVHIDGLISPFLELGIGFNPELSGRDNVYLNATILGMTRKQIDAKFNDIVAFSELEKFIDQKLNKYSSGMQVRLAFSVAIHANREILLMDEVLAVGDSNFQRKCIAEFNNYRNLGKTVILVTHDMLTAQKYCDRLMLIRKGKIQSIGNPKKVSNEYIFQNMSDEEKRILEEERAVQEKEKVAQVKIEKKKVKVAMATVEAKARNESKIKDNVREFGNRKIVVDGVEILNEKGEKRHTFLAGEQVIIRINYTTKNETLSPHFGIGISDLEGHHLVSTNHLRRTQIIEKMLPGESGKVECVINKFPLLNGTYNVSIFVYSDKIAGTPVAIHHINNAVKITITNSNVLSDDGLIFLDCKWNINYKKLS